MTALGKGTWASRVETGQCGVGGDAETGSGKLGVGREEAPGTRSLRYVEDILGHEES